MGRLLQLVEKCNWYKARFIQYLDKDHQEGLLVVDLAKMLAILPG